MRLRPAQTALERVIKARSALILAQPFWGCLILNSKIVETRDIETAATDSVHLFVNPDFVQTLTDAELCGVLAHEAEHDARLHCFRRGQRDLNLWNIACDLAINPDLIAAGFRLPQGALVQARFRRQSAEQIYKTLAREQQQQQQPQQGQGQPQQGQGQPQQGQGQPQQGQGQPQPQKGAPDPGQCGGVLDAPVTGADRDEAEAQVQARVRQAAAVAKRAGTAAGHASDLVQSLDAPRVDWRTTLRRFADDASLRDTSWTRRSRRSAGSVFLPGQASIAPRHLVCIVDTSGSMDERALRAIGSEVQALLDEGATDQVTLVQCDTRVRHAACYQAGDTLDLNMRGRGGTAFAPAFHWVEQNAPDASAIVYLTDLDCTAWGDEPACPVLWAATDKPRETPFGEVIAIDPHA